MKRIALTLAATLGASPAFAASGPFFSLGNTDFVVLLAFILFIAILIYFKVPGTLTKMLDDRADGIAKEIDEAKALREEAQSLVASFERKQKEVQEQADRIVTHAREEAERAAVQAKADIEHSVARRLAGAEEQIGAAQAAAIRDVKNKAVTVATAAAQQVLAKQMDSARANKLIEDGIAEAAAKLH